MNFRWHHGWHKFWRITLSIVEIWQQNFSQDWFFNEEQKGEYLHGEQTRITVTRIYYNIWINQGLYNYLYEYVIQFYVDSFPLFDLRECIMRLSISNLVHKCFQLMNIKNRNIYWSNSTVFCCIICWYMNFGAFFFFLQIVAHLNNVILLTLKST